MGIPALPFCHLALQAKKRPPKGYPTDPQTLGEHLKKRRMDLGLRQKEAASRLETSVCNVVNWETGRTSPSLHFVPKIIDLLGYSPFDTSQMTPGQQILAYRWMHGLSQKQLAAELGVDPGMIRRWEQGENRPSKRLRETLVALLAHEKGQASPGPNPISS